MAFFSQEKKQQKLILILILAIIAIFITVYFGLIRPKSSIPKTAPVKIMFDEDMDSAENGEIEDINFLFLQDPRFLELKKYGEWPIKPREAGRENPFEPFTGYNVEEIVEEIAEEEILEEIIIEEPITEPEENEKSVEKETIEELLRLLNGDGEE